MKGGSIEVFLLDFQCRIKVGAIDSAATDEKKKNLLYFGCDFSGWYNFGKIIKIVAIQGRTGCSNRPWLIRQIGPIRRGSLYALSLY